MAYETTSSGRGYSFSIYGYFNWVIRLTIIAVVAWALLDIVITGSLKNINIAYLLEAPSPYMWASMGVSLCIGLSVFGAA
ncbi:hypothetical protein HK096_009502, partial [Nowakowskiella sp. JEL0078]